MRRENDKMSGGMSNVNAKVVKNGCEHNRSEGFHRVEHACYITKDGMNQQCLQCDGDMNVKMYCGLIG